MRSSRHKCRVSEGNNEALEQSTVVCRCNLLLLGVVFVHRGVVLVEDEEEQPSVAAHPGA